MVLDMRRMLLDVAHPRRDHITAKDWKLLLVVAVAVVVSEEEEVLL